MKDLGNRQVPNNRRPRKEIVQEIQSRSDYPNFDVQTYNYGQQEGCNREVVLYAEHAIIPINDLTMMWARGCGGGAN